LAIFEVLARGAGIRPIISFAGEDQDRISGLRHLQRAGCEPLSHQTDDFRFCLTGRPGGLLPLAHLLYTDDWHWHVRKTLHLSQSEKRRIRIDVRRLMGGQIHLLEQLKICHADVATFTYRIHEDSDQIFISISGVTGGYILRRRVPTALFDPIHGAVNQKNFSAQDAHRHVRDYFQSFFAHESASENPSAIFHLSAREQEILNYVSKGHLDKEIAASLGLSVFTIHNHLKNIYEKLGVHNRTEAASKYLQK
jgi:DNA-binding NarL/FixJ family response regulator